MLYLQKGRMRSLQNDLEFRAEWRSEISRLSRTWGLIALVVLLSIKAQPSLAEETADAKQDGRTAIVTPLADGNKQSGRYDIDATGTDIRFVLEALARCSGANIVVSPDISGAITAHLKQSTVDEILAQFSLVQGFGWKKDNNTYLVASKDRFTEPPSVKVEPKAPETTLFIWTCHYLKPSEAAATIRELFPNIKVSQGPGAITPVLDSYTSGLTIAGSSANTGGSSDTTPRGSSSTGSGQTANSSSNSIVLIGTKSDIDKVKEALESLDVARSQVLIKVAIIEISNNAQRDLGITWSYSDIKLAETKTDSGIGFGTFKRENLAVSGSISALIKNGDAKLLAEPSISVLDSECASILIGDRILFPKLVGYSQAGTPIYDKEEERVGIYLRISARVANSNEVVMTVFPQVSLVTGYLKTQAGDYPQISTREARTTVSMKNNEPLIIGGLIRDNDIKDVSKVPLLGDLPIIGGFFRHTKTSKEHNEIVITLTPTIQGAK